MKICAHRVVGFFTNCGEMRNSGIKKKYAIKCPYLSSFLVYPFISQHKTKEGKGKKRKGREFE